MLHCMNGCGRQAGDAQLAVVAANAGKGAVSAILVGSPGQSLVTTMTNT